MSVPGNYSGLNEVDEFGLCRLGKVLHDEGWRPSSGEVVQAEFQVRAYSAGSWKADRSLGILVGDLLFGLV